MRDSGLEDAEAIARLLEAAGYERSAERATASLTLFRDWPGAHCFSAVDGDEVVGFVAVMSYPMFHAAARCARIAVLAVAPRHRGKSVGRELVSAAEAYAKSIGCDRIEVTANERRTSSHAFYERLGYDGNSRRFVRLL